MPGIVAIIDQESSNYQSDQSLLKTMAHAITHEEWHKVETYSQPPLYIARVHSGIDNIEQQPIFNEDNSICIFMDGHVFGYEEEKKRLEAQGHNFRIDNDPEFCLHLFEEYGEAFVERLNGSFVIIIYDSHNGIILIANDRHGLLPVYHAKIGKRYVYSSEVKAILEDKMFIKEVDHKAVADFFAFGRILGDKTLFTGIKALRPSSVTTFCEGNVSTKKYWDFAFKEDYDAELNEDYYIDKLATLFMNAVKRRTRKKKRYGVFLSGGMDSRLTAASIDKKCYPISTFTYGVEGGDEQQVAEMVAEKLGSNHRSMELKSDYLVSFARKGVYLTDGMLSCAHFHWISCLPTVREQADVMFHGLGLEPLLTTALRRVAFAHFYGSGSGILLEHNISKAEEERYASLFYQFLNSLIPEKMMPEFYSDAYYRKVKDYPRRSFREHLSTVKQKDPVNKTDSYWLHFFGRYYTSRIILRNYCEDRVPSLDNDFFDFAMRVPRKLRYGHQELYFKLLARLNPLLARVPYQRTGVPPIMPTLAHRIGFLFKGGYKLIVRKLRKNTNGLISLPNKIGYPDYSEWIRNDPNLRKFFEDTLLDKRTLDRGYFNPEFVTSIVRDHMSGSKDWIEPLCALLTFELWHRLFIDVRAS